MKIDQEFTLYTDGACSQTIGGFASVVVSPSGKHLPVADGPFKDTTNNQMEMMAVIAGLNFIHKRMGPRNVLVISDSKYVINGITQWIHNWKKNGWITAGGKLVKNAALWERMEEARNLHSFTRFEWVKGHAGNHFNELADQLAVSRRTSDEKHKSLGVTA